VYCSFIFNSQFLNLDFCARAMRTHSPSTIKIQKTFSLPLHFYNYTFFIFDRVFLRVSTKVVKIFLVLGIKNVIFQSFYCFIPSFMHCWLCYTQNLCYLSFRFVFIKDKVDYFSLCWC